ncbi:MAG: aminotransferase class I/II-fold pyridoxal phosphate-dependent enzyme [Pseudomonadota bacterium]
MRSSTRSGVDSFIVMDVMEAARAAEAAGRDIVHMEVGQPATGAPLVAQQAVAVAMATGPMGYTVALGMPELRARIAQQYQEWYGVTVSPERIVITEGASAGFILAFLALFDAGQSVGIADPGYPSYRNILRALDLKPARIEGTLANRFQPTPADVHAGLDGLLVASPANPTGSMLDLEAMTALVEACAQHDVALISDEIYQGIQFSQKAVTALQITDEVVVVNSFSKYYSMTGWRIGWIVVPDALVRTVERLAQNLFICPPHVSQVAALAALDAGAELEGHVDVYRANRELLVEALPKLGFEDIAPPDGAFYLYASIRPWRLDAKTFCARMLDEAGVAATPGLDFDPERGNETIRFSYAGSTERMREAVSRLSAWLPKL